MQYQISYLSIVLPVQQVPKEEMREPFIYTPFSLLALPLLVLLAALLAASIALFA